MFGFLKPLLRKLVETPGETAPPPSSEFPSDENYEAPAPVPRSFMSSRPAAAAARPRTKCIELPLQTVLQTLPLELQPRVLCPEVGDATISVPLEKILAQL